MSDDVWIGVDLGTQSARAVAVSDHGLLLASAAEPLRSIRRADRHEQDPADWLAAAMHALRRVTASLPAGHLPRALAVSGTSGTLVPVDAVTGAPRGMGVMYDDRRGGAHLEAVQSAGAGLWRRLGYRMQPSWGLPTLVQMLADGALSPGSVIAHQPDVITSMLAGHLLPSDLSSALKTGADLDAVRWPDDVFAELRVPVSAVNRLTASGTIIGSVGASGSEATGLPQGCLIVAGMTDGCAAQIAAGALHPGDWNSVLGTTLVLKGASAVRHVDASGAVYAHRAPFGAGWYPGGASSTGAGAISSLLPGRDLDALAEMVEQDGRSPVAYPLIGRGERFPFVAPDAVALLPDGDDVAVFSAILHGVAYLERLAFDLLAVTGYDTSGEVLLTGGGARSVVWNQLRADVLQRDVTPAAHTEGAIGMAILAAAGRKAGRSVHPDQDPMAAVAARMIPAASTVAPRANRRASLSDGYLGFVDHLAERGWISPELARAATEGVNE